ncbi:hypothetical protein AVEN_44360-1 [Araneus ventricosus]|uniref:Uncharacterized protein n=1 Tax=Araneus ventricosus TaxID=182803 RepID=A0A4Y2SUZ5_ARAVE|nr:hypothetical protein AVEN_44360-1 [Araneus ventricosus]
METMISLISRHLVATILTMTFLYQSSTGRTISNSNDDSTDERFAVDVDPPENPFMDPNSWMFDPDASEEHYAEFNRRPASLTFPSGNPTFTLDWPSDPDASYER